MKMLKDMQAGETFEVSRDVGKYDPYFYAGASGDFNLIHIDDEFAKSVGHKSKILQGLCTMAFVATANTDRLEDPYQLKRVRVRFRGPVHPNDTVKLAAKVMERDGGTISVVLEGTNQDGKQVITDALAVVKVD